MIGMTRWNESTRYTISKIVSFALLCVSLFVSAFGVSSEAAADGESAAAVASSTGLEEITVTATRRPELLRDVPMSVTAYNQSAMDAAGVKGIDEIARLTPGLTFTSVGFGGTNNIAIRGVSSTVGAATTGGVHRRYTDPESHDWLRGNVY